MKWEPDNFQLEYNSVWSFPERGNWATHDSKWRGNWSPYIPRNILLRYSNMNELVLDQFAGGGTTLIEAKLLNRNIIGVDINTIALQRCKEKINFKHEGANGKIYLRKGDARNLDFISDECIDLICTHPPYADIIKYSENIKGDLSLLNVEDFINEMKLVAIESYRVLKKRQVLCYSHGRYSAERQYSSNSFLCHESISGHWVYVEGIGYKRAT